MSTLGILEPKQMSTKARLWWGGASLLILVGGVVMLFAR